MTPVRAFSGVHPRNFAAPVRLRSANTRPESGFVRFEGVLSKAVFLLRPELVTELRGGLEPAASFVFRDP